MNIRLTIEVDTLDNTDKDFEWTEKDIMERIKESMQDFKVTKISSKEFPI